MIPATTIYTSSTPEVADLLGVTYRQLHHWVTRGWISGLAPKGAGNRPDLQWHWAPEQIAAARMVRDHLDHARALLADPTRCHRCPCRDGGS